VTVEPPGAYSWDYSIAFDPPVATPDAPTVAQPVYPAYADVERLLVAWLPSQLDGTRTVTDLPSNLGSVLPLVQVTRLGGADLQPSLDRPVVDIDCYATDRAGASDLAQKVRDLVRLLLPGQQVDGVLVARVDTVSGPSWRPYDNTSLRRFGASYQLITQRGTT
jgi:hypothetical protein